MRAQRSSRKLGTRQYVIKNVNGQVTTDGHTLTKGQAVTTVGYDLTKGQAVKAAKPLFIKTSKVDSVGILSLPRPPKHTRPGGLASKRH